jgi:hypothetical protein
MMYLILLQNILHIDIYPAIKLINNKSIQIINLLFLLSYIKYIYKKLFLNRYTITNNYLYFTNLLTISLIFINQYLSFIFSYL